ncbi:exosome complex exonuclease Rrp41 [Candidatus Woesearchaeota archaeon]|nr:exosome complex exonuclease Rrp41 [Candidatus Woesearchaeota archaeon]MCF7901328.1 exosome complex exonuclease Rrp41 [Candidatus Woesearchaeota archaeon]MCF8014002.1 exosome complex exonuclease Rrp41 [Candidatus Woesearchaeota archaeon]
MTDFKRPSGRKFEDPRPMEAEAGVIGKADGSARFKIGDTEAYAAVYGPRELHPRFLQDPKTGILRCNYNMLPFAGDGSRVRPGPSRRSKEITHVTQSALRPVVDLSDYPNTVVDVFIELPQTDAGSRCAGICAAAIALADAGIKMKDMVSSVSVGSVEGNLLVDLDGAEEHMNENEGTDIPIAYIPSTEEITLLQMDGKILKDDLAKALELVKPALNKIAEVQRQALHKKYNSEIKE